MNRSHAARPAHHRGPRPRRRGVPAGLVVALAALALVAGAGLLILATSPRPAGGTIVPDHVLHDFGTVAINGGPVTASFPLAVQGTVVVTDLGTT